MEYFIKLLRVQNIISIRFSSIGTWLIVLILNSRKRREKSLFLFMLSKGIIFKTILWYISLSSKATKKLIPA